MDVRLDQPATGQPPAGIVRLRLRRQALPDGDNVSARDADIHRLLPAIYEPDIA